MKTVKQYIKNPKFGTGDEPEFLPIGNTGIDAVKNRLLQVERQELNLTIKNSKNYSTLTEAIADVTDDKYKFRGFVLTFSNGSEWKSYIYNGQDSSGFSDEKNWEEYSLGGSSSGTDVEITEEEPVSGNDAAVVYQIEDVPDEEVVEYITEAPADDSEYVRKNKGWVKSSGGGSSAEITKESVEAVLTGNIESHTHDTVYAPAETDVWDGVTVSKSLLGTGTKEDPYQINSCADWVLLITSGNRYGQESTSSKKYISVTKNLNFNNKKIDRTNHLIQTINGLNQYSDLLMNASINGNNNTFSNINVLNGNIIPFIAVCDIKNFNINGVVEYDLNTIDENATSGNDVFSNNCIELMNSNTLVPINPTLTFYNFVSKINIDITVNIRMERSLNNINTSNPILISPFTLFCNAKDIDTSIIYNLKSNITYNFDNVMDDSELKIINSICYVYSSSVHEPINITHKDIILDTTKNVNSLNFKTIDPKRPSVFNVGYLMDINNMIESDIMNQSTINIESMYSVLDQDNPITDSAKNKSIVKSESELKDPSFLNTLNSASGEDIWITGEDGFPTLNMQQKGVIQYDGYVKQSEFDKLKKNPAFNEGVVYIPYNVLFDTSNITRDEASAILGGNEGLQKIIEGIKEGKKLKISNITDNVAYSDIKTSIFQFNTIIGLNFKTVVVSPFGIGDLSCLIYYENNGKLSVYGSVTLLKETKYKGE